jgi:hypothetical protein
MTRTTKVVAALAAIGAMAAPGTAMALPNGNDAKGSVGSCIDNLHGNATNPRPDGPGVLPSLAPGPHTVAGGFLSVGEVHQAARALFPDATGVEINRAICLFP